MTMGERRRRLCASAWLLVFSVHAVLLHSFSYPPTFCGKQTSISPGAKPSSAIASDDDANDCVSDANEPSDYLNRRRQVLLSSIPPLLVLSQFPLVSNAGEVGARITKAVTTSDLGIAVRESVVRGAQTMDKVDGQWEQFSDKFGLGAARKQQDGKPVPKEIPDLKPLDVELARRVLETSDQTFLSLTDVSQNALAKQVDSVASKVRPSFERSGLDLDSPAQAFNFDSYAHFKAYGDLILKSNLSFNAFRKDFEAKMGQELVAMLLPQYRSNSSPKTNNFEGILKQRLKLVDQICSILVEKGFVAETERSTLDDERVADWSEDLSDLTFSLALDGDVTQNAQILLQEQGFRLYPNYIKYIVTRLLELPQQTVTIDDYYLDTDYNSDPNRFQVKQVLLNIVLDSSL